MEYDRNNLLNKVLEYHFACIELNLYLDNNPNDENALNDYNKYSEKLQRAKENYESQYGPLTNFGYVKDCYDWKWINQPWPWHNEFYK